MSAESGAFGEAIDAVLARVVTQHIDDAMAGLRSRSVAPHEAVHRSRKAMRSARAVLRLLRGVLGEETCAAQAGVLRHAGHLLSAHRDARVLLLTLDHLCKRAAARGEEAAEVRERVEEWLDLTTPPLEPAALRAEQLVGTLRKGLENGARSGPDAADDVARRLGRSYERVCARLDDARRRPTPERLHELRKRSKDLREQLRALRPPAGGPIDRVESELAGVCDRLGAARDLDLVRRLLEDRARDNASGAALMRRLIEVAEDRRDRLEASGLKHARRASGARSAAAVKDFRRAMLAS